MVSTQQPTHEYLGLLGDIGELLLSKYDAIEKVGREVLIGKGKYTTRDVYKLGAVIAMQDCADRYNALIASLQATGQLSKDNAKRARRGLQAAAADTETVRSSALIVVQKGERG